MSHPILDEETGVVGVPQNKWIVSKTTHQRLFTSFVLALGALYLVISGKELLTRDSYVVEIIHSYLFSYLFIVFYGAVATKYLLEGNKKKNSTALYTFHNLLLSIFFGLGIALGLIHLLYPLYAVIQYLLLSLLGRSLEQLELGGMVTWLVLYTISILVVALGHYGWYNNGFQEYKAPLTGERAGWKSLSKPSTIVFLILWMVLLYSHQESYYASSSVQYKMLEMLFVQDVALLVGGVAVGFSVVAIKRHALYTQIVEGIQGSFSFAGVIVLSFCLFLLFCVFLLISALVAVGILYALYAFFGDGKIGYSTLAFGWFMAASLPPTALLAYGAAYTLDYIVQYQKKK